MVKVVWTQTALNQLERIVKYVALERGTSSAKVVGHRIIERSEHLASFPKMGSIEQLLSHKKSEYRYLVVWSYKIIYRVSTDRVVVSRVFHTSQNPKKLRGS